MPLNGPLTLYFNQDMDRASVEATLRSQMGDGLAFTWLDNSTVVVYLNEPLPPESEFALQVSDQMRSSQGKPLLQTVSLNYVTAGYLAPALRLPEENAQDVDPTGAIIVAFNRPVVALGANDQDKLPAGFTLSPAAQGRDAWINTSTYAFYPEPGLDGGVTYTVQVNPNLKSVDGGPLRDAAGWSFTTSRPAFVAIEPSTEQPWPLDAKVALKFNQPMDAAAVEAAFALIGPDGAPMAGALEWNEAGDTLTFTPNAPLARSTSYRLTLSAQAQGRGGAPLDVPLDAQVVTVEALRVTGADLTDGLLDPNSSLGIYFSAPLQTGELERWVTLDPAVPNLNVYWDETQMLMHIFGSFAASSAYTLHLSPDLPDRWGGTLGEEYVYSFNTGAYQPDLNLVSPSSTVFLTGSDASLRAQAVNLSEVPTKLGPLTLAEYFAVNGPRGYEQMQALKDRPAPVWTQPVSASPDRMGPVELYLSPDRSPLAPGIYFFHFNFPEDTQEAGGKIYNGPFLLAVSNLQLTLKVGATQALVWATDVATGAPAAGASVTLYDETGAALAQGQTDTQGIYQAEFEPLDSPYAMIYAVIGQPGDPNFGMALSSWSAGLDAWDFGIRSLVKKPGLKTYLYTDRPMYRPGQKVYFRAVVRQAFNGRYTPPEIASLPVVIFGNEGQELAAFDLPVSPLGTAHGEYDIPGEAAPGYYSIGVKDQEDSLGFQVANYRKPEINLQVAFGQENAQAEETLSATINARYFFDAPAGGLPLRWTLYRSPAYFSLPGYQVGREDISWMDPFHIPEWSFSLGQQVKEGEARTGPDGLAAVEVPTEASDVLWQYTLEVTLTDESGLPVSARASAHLNPDAFFIGVRAENWVGRSGEEIGFEIQTVDWQKEPVGGSELRAEFQKITWKRTPPPANQPYAPGTYEAQYSSVGSTDLATGPDGKARVTFTPVEPGTYLLDVFNRRAVQDQGARSQVLLWVGGPGQAAWPNLPNSRLHLTADRDEYQPGDIAQVFIPNPFSRDVPALITIERSIVMKHEIITIPAEGYTLQLELPADYAPNVYLSVVLLGGAGETDFRQGFLNLPVTPQDQTLQVALVGQPERAGPGDTVNFEIQVTDASGAPVQGEFSLAVVDLAALALADPNAPDIVPAFYGEQPLGVRTGMALAAYNHRLTELPGGLGGGGGADVPQVARENFPDTAYWNAQVETGADGKAQVSVTLPDTLTTWKVDARGVTASTQVGQAQSEVITTKELLVRPVTPRFFVAGDHVQLAAVVQNNTERELDVRVGLQTTSIRLDDAGTQSQPVVVPAGGRARVEWWGVVEDVEAVNLVFLAEGDGLSDATRPAAGALPVLRYFTPQAYRTSGVMDAGDEVTELVSLPRSFDPQSGQLSVELSPSLAAAMSRALDVLENQPYESTEAALSSFLPNLETYRTLQQFGVEDPSLKSKLDRSLNAGLQRLLARQNFDGGWGWWQGNESDAFMTTYAVFGLLRAREAGVTVNPDIIQKAVTYLQEHMLRPAVGAVPAKLGAPSAGGGGWPPLPWQWDRMAFQSYVLSEAGNPDAETVARLLEARDQLSPWAQALLALTLEQQQPGSEDAKTILSGLQTDAVRSASGAFWPLAQTDDGRQAAGFNMQTDLSDTAVVVFALAQRDPGSPLVADAVRYLMAARGADGSWNSTYTTAWALMALNEVMKGTGETSGKFSFEATLNGNPFAQGQAAGASQVNPVTAQAPIGRLYADYPNVLTITRGDGSGRLYYTAGLEVSRPVEDVAPLSAGLSIERGVFPFGDACPDQDCEAVTSAVAGQKVTVRLSLTLPNPVHYLAVSDYIPAGAEILNVALKTSEQGVDGEPQVQANYDPRRPFDRGWGWWLFNQPQIYDDHILWTANYLAAGSYELTYTLALLQPGQYRVLPARAWQLYFPDVQANSAGSVFEITAP